MLSFSCPSEACRGLAGIYAVLCSLNFDRTEGQRAAPLPFLVTGERQENVIV